MNISIITETGTLNNFIADLPFCFEDLPFYSHRVEAVKMSNIFHNPYDKTPKGDKTSGNPYGGVQEPGLLQASLLASLEVQVLST